MKLAITDPPRAQAEVADDLDPGMIATIGIRHPAQQVAAASSFPAAGLKDATDEARHSPLFSERRLRTSTAIRSCRAAVVGERRRGQGAGLRTDRRRSLLTPWWFFFGTGLVPEREPDAGKTGGRGCAWKIASATILLRDADPGSGSETTAYRRRSSWMRCAGCASRRPESDRFSRSIGNDSGRLLPARPPASSATFARAENRTTSDGSTRWPCCGANDANQVRAP